MAGEIEGLENTLDRVRQLQSNLARTTNPTERRAIQDKLREAKRDHREAIQSVKAAARSGDRTAREFIDGLETLEARSN